MENIKKSATLVYSQIEITKPTSSKNLGLLIFLMLGSPRFHLLKKKRKEEKKRRKKNSNNCFLFEF